MIDKNTSVPIYKLRGIDLIGWRDKQHAINYLFSDNYIKNNILIAINAEKMIIINDDSKIYKLIDKAKFKYADGISIIRSIRKKYPTANVSRIAGIDLWESLMINAGIKKIPVFLIGSKIKILTKTVKKLRLKWNVNIVGIQDGYFSNSDKKLLFKSVKNSGAKIVAVAMGSPYQEILMSDCYYIYPDALYIGVGGAYDIFAGYLKRAPQLWQNLGLEWLYRLFLQPFRIKRQVRLLRYLYWHYTGKL